MRELLYTWGSWSLLVLVPKIRGVGFLKVPLGHHHDPFLSQMEQDCRCDITGLDGHLDFDCRLGGGDGRRDAFVAQCIPKLEKHYKCPSREIGHGQFFDLIPL